MPFTSKVIEYQDGGTHLAGVMFADSAQAEPRPGILVVHGGAGLDDHAKKRAKALADLGFVAFACDMYGSAVRGNPERIMATLLEFRQDAGRLCRRAQAGLDILLSSPEVDGRIGAVGYCFGGMTVLELARAGADLAGIVSVHGSLASAHPAHSGTIKAKILVCHGALDLHVPMPDVTAFIEEMNQAGADWQLIIYGGALHGFTHESGPTRPGVAYNPAADARSTIAMKDFFVEVFC
jgi:dienelactone hydrolase